MKLEEFPQQVTLRDGTQVLIRPMEPADGPELLAFFRALPEEDRQFLRDDVTNPDVVDRFVRSLDYDTVMPLLAEHDGEIVGDGTLHRSRHGWATHVGEIRVVVATSFQRRGLGAAIAGLLVKQAVNLGLDKLVAHVIESQVGARRAFEKLGFVTEAVLKGQVKDIHGTKRDLVILANDVSYLWESMEALLADYSPTLEG